MGQYYQGVIFSDDLKEMKVLNPWHYGMGIKLMEHAYMDNLCVNAMYSTIADRPKRVAWIGDYADERYGDIWEKRLDDNVFKDIFKHLWDDECVKQDYLMYCNDRPPRMFLINHTRREMVDMSEYRRQTKPDEYGNIVDPLPLLIAVGNGRGGGDYKGSCMEYIGSWAFDTIEYTSDMHAHCDLRYTYKDIPVRFEYGVTK